MERIERKTETCEIHGEYESLSRSYLDPEGEKWTDWNGCGDCRREAEQAEREAIARESEIARATARKMELGFDNIPPRFVGKTFENWIADTPAKTRALSICKRYATNFEQVQKNGTSLTLCGGVGTGKTHLAAAIVNHLTENGTSAIYVSLMTMIKAIKRKWGKNESDESVYEQLENCGCLLIDEVGVQFGSDTEKLILFEVINARYEQMKPTVIISNLSADDLTVYVGQRVMDRLREGGGPVIAFEWESERSKL